MPLFWQTPVKKKKQILSFTIIFMWWNWEVERLKLNCSDQFYKFAPEEFDLASTAVKLSIETEYSPFFILMIKFILFHFIKSDGS